MNIYLQNETDFVHNGLGFLNDILNANVTDNLNGDYSLFFEYKVNGNLSEYLENENIVKCQVSDGSKQLFIIKSVVKTFNSIQVNAKHIFYQLLDNFIEDAAPTNLSCPTFFSWLLGKTNYEHPFKGYSDISLIKSARYVRRNPVDCILGNTGNSMVNLFNGEIKRDNFNIYFNKQVGYDNGVKLIVGKNITGINISTDTSSVHTRIMPQGFNGLLLPEKYVDSPLINNYLYPKVYKVEFSDIKYNPEDKNSYQTEEEAFEALRSSARKLFEDGVDKPIINVKVDWIELSKTNEYKNFSNLEKVNLGDVITIDLLGISYKSRIIKTIYNPLTDRIESFEIGSPKANLGTSTNNIQKQLEKINSDNFLQDATDIATSLITNALAGNIHKTKGELFIMDTNDTSTATKVWRWNLNGLGYSKSGIDGPYELAMTMNGSINASFITSGILKAIGAFFKDVTIEGGKITLEDNGITDPSIVFKKITKTLGDIELGTELSSAILFHNFDKYIEESPERIEDIPLNGVIFVTENGYKLNCNKWHIGDANNIHGWYGEVFISKDSDESYHETIYKAYYTYYDEFEVEINNTEFELPFDFGKVVEVNKEAVPFNFFKKESVTEDLTNYSSTGINAKIFTSRKYNSEDYQKLVKHLQGNLTLNSEEQKFLDANGDNKLNVADTILVLNNGGKINVSKDRPGELIIDTLNPEKTIRLIDKDGNVEAAIGLDGLYASTKNNLLERIDLLEVGETLSYKPKEVETVCGTWIDGKRIYRKIIEIPSWNDEDYSITHTEFISSEVDTLVKLDGFIYNQHNCYCPLNMWYSNNNQVSAHFSTNDGCLRIKSTYSCIKGYIIAEYTKTGE